MKKYKIYLLNRIISVHKGFSVYNDYSIYKKDYFLRLKSFIKNFKLDKYYLINLFCDLIIEFLFLITNILFYPLSIYLSLKKFKIVIVDPMSFGDFFIDMSIIIKESKNKKKDLKKLIFLIPKETTVFKISNKILNEVFTIKSNLALCLILYSISFFNKKILFRTGQYQTYKKKIYYIFPKNSASGKFKSLSKKIIIQNELNKIDYKLPKNIFVKLNRKLEKSVNYKKKYNKKTIILNLRDINRGDAVRNSNHKNFYLLIKKLISENYKIYYFYDKRDNFKLFSNSKNFFSYKIKGNEILQFFIYIKSQYYVGTLNGPFHLAQFLNLKSLCVDVVDFNSSIIFKKIKILPKKIKYKFNDKFISFHDLYKKNLENNYNNYNLDQNKVKFVFSNSNEILRSFNELKNTKNFNENNFKSNNGTVLRYTVKNFISNNKHLFN